MRIEAKCRWSISPQKHQKPQESYSQRKAKYFHSLNMKSFPKVYYVIEKVIQ
jgi:hypothetical protein